jgi:hypothetical protein
MCKERLKLASGYYAGWAILRNLCQVMKDYLYEERNLDKLVGRSTKAELDEVRKELEILHRIEDHLIDIFGEVYKPSCTYKRNEVK